MISWQSGGIIIDRDVPDGIGCHANESEVLRLASFRREGRKTLLISSTAGRRNS